MTKSTEIISSCKEVAREVLRLEQEALEILGKNLDSNFDRVTKLFLDIRGRIIVTGMGKSGLVGRKIASTFSSTGSPAFFLHPGEASHGDLGMVTAGDAILALSSSGETQELAHIIQYSRRHGIPLVSMTQGAKSSLAQESDFVLLLPPLPEACPNGLAPTTSTTMMIALGDALAIVLLKKRAFSKDDFKLLHPGGRLGTRLRRVKELMHKNHELPLIAEGVLMSEALLEMTSKSFGCVGIVNKSGVLTGIITDGDLRRHMAFDLMKKCVEDVMTKLPRTIVADALIEEALHVMEGKITVLFVLDNMKKPVGLLHIHDILRMERT